MGLLGPERLSKAIGLYISTVDGGDGRLRRPARTGPIEQTDQNGGQHDP
jgi:hypothetical protein